MPLPVLIIGGGLGGLCLAQGLKKANVPFKLFERDEQSNFRAQGYRLRISGDGVYALQSALMTKVWTLFELTCAEKPVLNGFQLNAFDGTPLSNQPFGPPPGVTGPRPYTVDRTILREVLLIDLEEHVCFGKRFTHYILHDHAVTAHFADGTSAPGALLVGADGLRSRVRKQLLPHFKHVDTGMCLIYGKTPLTPDLSAQLAHTPLLNAPALVVDSNPEAPKSLLFEPIRFSRHADCANIKLPDDYIYWVLVTRLSTLPAADRSLCLDHEQASRLILQLTKSWHPSVRALLEEQDPAQTSTLPLFSTPPDLPAWHLDPRVTLLGDATHVMPPTGGIGANSALRDAAALARMVGEKWADKEGVGEGVVGAYEEEMREYARVAIERSWIGGMRSFGLKGWDECEVVVV